VVGSSGIPGSETDAVSEWKPAWEESAARASSAPGALRAPADAAPLSRLEAAALAHRLRNPLSAIHHSVETLGRHFQAGTPESELCEIALEETRRLERTVARALHGARSLERASVEIGALVRSVTELAERRSRAGGATPIRLRLEQPALRAEVDPDRLSEALWSLLENALEAVRGGGQIDVAVAPQHSLGVAGVRIDVRDDGAGFDAAAQQGGPAASASARPQGIGLGLLIARDVAHAHGGFLRLRNAAEGGARVSLWLPLEPAGR